MPAILVALNLTLFLVLAAYGLWLRKSETVDSIGLLWSLMVLPAAAVVLGGIQRLALQGWILGWLPDGVEELLLGSWQIAQSAVVAALGLVAFFRMRKIANRLSDLEHAVGEMVDRVASVDIRSLELTPRERNVLSLIGSNTAIDDRALADTLSVSRDTAHTHVGRLLKKTGLKDRRDLQIVAFIMKTQEGHHPFDGAYHPKR